MSDQGYAGDISAQEAWRMLETDPRAMLVDVRTQAEWAYVGIPDLSHIEKQPLFIPWALFPAMEPNPNFVDQLAKVHTDREAPLLFLCRSGVRSRAAAMAMTARGYVACYNVAAGFEGDLDPARHRGTLAGWKVGGLPWIQG